MCSIDLRRFMFVRKSINPECFDPLITSIFDVFSRQTFPPTLDTLISFGAKNICLGYDYTISEKSVKNSKKVLLLGQDCPGLFFDSLK
jgi:hypothetical protein